MWLLVLALVVAAVAACARPTPTPIPVVPAPVPTLPACTFQLGFAEVQRRIPDVVGECVGNEQPQPSGDSHQRTTNGLLVWRKADGAIGFTDGHRSWVRGPDGEIRIRLNDERFPFEPDPPGVTLRVVQPGPPVVSAAGAPAAEPSKAELTAQERAYAAYMGEWSRALGAALDETDAASRELERRPELRTDERWRTRVRDVLARIDVSAEKMETYDPVPDRFARLDVLMVATGRDSRRFARRYAEALEASDAAQLDAAARDLGAARTSLQDANGELLAATGA
jgi:hypothetical protein